VAAAAAAAADDDDDDDVQCIPPKLHLLRFVADLFHTALYSKLQDKSTTFCRSQ